MAMFGNTKRLEPVSGSSSLALVNFAKVFLYMFMYLLITGGVAFGLGYVISTSYVNSGYSDTVPTLYLGLIIGSAVALFILVLIINFVFIRGKHSVLVPSIIYAVLVGVLLSTFTIFVDWVLIGMAFAITAGVFGLMSLIAFLTKGSMAPLLMLAFGLFIGGAILGLVNFLIRSEMIAWVVSFVIFAAVMFVAMFDIWRIKKIAEQGEMSKNLSYYCAFVMYVDFINIFVRILYYLIIIFGNRK